MANKKKKIYEGVRDFIKGNPKKAAAVGAAGGAGAFANLPGKDPVDLPPPPPTKPKKSAPNIAGAEPEAVEESKTEETKASIPYIGPGALPKTPVPPKAETFEEFLEGSNLKEVHEDEKKELLTALNKQDNAIDSAADLYTRSLAGIEKAKLWRNLVQGFTQMFAGLYGLRTGVNVGGLKFDPIDYTEEIKMANSRLNTEINRAKSRTSSVKERQISSKAQREEAFKEKRNKFDAKQAAAAQGWREFQAVMQTKQLEMQGVKMGQEARTARAKMQQAQDMFDERQKLAREQMGAAKEQGKVQAATEAKEKQEKAYEKATEKFGRVMQAFQKDESDENRERLRLLNNESFRKTGRYVVPPDSFEKPGLLFGTNEASTQDLLKAQQKFLSLSDTEQQAASWAYTNKKDPRAKEILKRLKLGE